MTHQWLSYHLSISHSIIFKAVEATPDAMIKETAVPQHRVVQCGADPSAQSSRPQGLAHDPAILVENNMDDIRNLMASDGTQPKKSDDDNSSTATSQVCMA